jgi:hypothetical protein
MDTMLTERIQRLIADLLQAETRATQLLHLARERRLSFGLPYTYIDEDIAQLVGRHQTRLLSSGKRHWALQEA